MNNGAPVWDRVEEALDGLPGDQFLGLSGGALARFPRQILNASGQQVQAITAAGPALSVDVSRGRMARVTLTGDVTSIALTNWPPDGVATTLFLEVENHDGHAMTGWPAGTMWTDSAGPPVLGAGYHLLSIYSSRGGARLYGMVPGLNFA